MQTEKLHLGKNQTLEKTVLTLDNLSLPCFENFRARKPLTIRSDDGLFDDVRSDALGTNQKFR